MTATFSISGDAIIFENADGFRGVYYVEDLVYRDEPNNTSGRYTLISGTIYAYEQSYDGVDQFSLEDISVSIEDAILNPPDTTVGFLNLFYDGDDEIYGSSGDDTLWGYRGDDLLEGGLGNDTLYGNLGDDSLYGGLGADRLVGAEGADLLDGGRGADMMEGGAGNDTYMVDNANDVVTEAAGEGTDTVVTTLASYQLSANVENLTLTEDAGERSGTGNSLDNVIRGAAGAANTLSGLNGDDLLVGRALADTLQGGNGDDILRGYGGADLLDGGNGADVMEGGKGSDTYVVDNANDVVTEAGGQGNDTVLTTLAAYQLSANVENLTLTGDAGDRSGTGNARNNEIRGAAGAANTLYGQNGNDLLIGRDGDDTLYGGKGADTLTGNGGADYMQGGAGGDTLEGGGGDDTLYGGAGKDTLRGAGGDDLLNGGSGADSMEGGKGDDTYVVDNANDAVTEAAGEGTDTVITTLASYELGANLENLTLNGSGDERSGSGNSRDNEIRGATGANNTLSGLKGADILIGRGRADTFYGGLGDDDLRGNGGGDWLDGGKGADSMAGGAGNDTYVVDNAGDVVIESADAGRDTVMTSLSTYTLTSNVENLEFSGATGPVTGTGNAVDNVITGQSDVANTLSGGAGDDELTGGSQDDVLDGGTGADTMTGGAGDDTYVVDDADDTVVENASDGTDTILSSLSTYTLGDNLENLTFSGASGTVRGTGNALDNTITGQSDVVNRLWGEAGDDTLIGGDEDDRLDGGTGADSMSGGAGDDVYLVDDAGDTVDEADGEGSDQVRTTLASYTLGDNVERLKLLGNDSADELEGTGNALDNEILGYSGTANVLSGLGGADTITGGKQGDQLSGGGGNDELRGLAGDDTLQGGNGQDTLYGQGGRDQLYGDGGADTLYGGGGDDALLGGAGSDSLYGGSGEDLIYGGDGADLLDGGSGADSMYGGAGDDTYVVENSDDYVSEEAEEGTDLVRTSLGSYTLSSYVENLELDGSGAQTGTGNDLANEITVTGDFDYTLYGMAGDDTLTAGAGNDILDGGTGADTMTGGAGDDTYVVDDAGDVVVELASGGTDLVNTALDSYTLGDNVEYLGLLEEDGTATERSGTGNDLDNRITGATSADNTLSGLGGNDTIYGGVGADTIDGGDGDDTIYGGDEVFNSSEEFYPGDTIDGGAGNDTIYAEAGDDTLNGGDGDDLLDGGADYDYLYGGLGADSLYGDGDAAESSYDTFIFKSFEESRSGDGNRDTIYDFEQGNDVIDLSEIVISDGANVELVLEEWNGEGYDENFYYVAGDGDSSADVIIHVVFDGTDTHIIADYAADYLGVGTADTSLDADFEILLKGEFELDRYDFYLSFFGDAA